MAEASQKGLICIADKRTRNVEGRLLQALVSTAQEKSLDAITVSDLVRRAEVGRASFYRYFRCVDDVAAYGVDILRAEFWRSAPQNEPFLSMSMLVHTFEFYRTHRELILAYERCGRAISLLDIVTESMALSYGDMPESSLERYGVDYYAGAFYALMIHWLRDGAQEPPEVMARFFLDHGRL